MQLRRWWTVCTAFIFNQRTSKRSNTIFSVRRAGRSESRSTNTAAAGSRSTTARGCCSNRAGQLCDHHPAATSLPTYHSDIITVSRVCFFDQRVVCSKYLRALQITCMFLTWTCRGDLVDKNSYLLATTRVLWRYIKWCIRSFRRSVRDISITS